MSLDASPTPWSFVPAGILAGVALGLFLVWPAPVDASEFVAPSIWPLILFAFHFVAAIGCIRGSTVFLWRRTGTLTRRTRAVALAFLVVSTCDLAAWIVLFSWIHTWALGGA